MKIAVCDDNSFDRNALCQYIYQYSGRNYYSVDIDLFNGGEDLLKSFKKGKYQMLFLDVYMGGISGIETARKLRKLDENCIIILSTVSTDHALEGYQVKALYYIVKPINFEKVETALNLCRDYFKRTSSYIDIMRNKQNMRIFCKNIAFIEVYGKTSIIHTENDEIKTYVPLDEMEKKLGGAPFYRCHRSYIVSFDHVMDIEGNDFILKDGSRVPIRKTGIKDAKITFTKYINSR